MILPDDKRAPPPPYPAAAAEAAPPRTNNSRSRSHNTGPKLSDLAPNLLLHIVEATFLPSSDDDAAGTYLPGDGLVEAHRRNLYWLTISLRLVNRGFYIACMCTLRSTYVDPYLSMVKPPYTSDPFPLGSADAAVSADSPTSSSSSSPSPSPIRSLQRETQVLDRFIALKTHEDVRLDETDLHLEREESFNDLFVLTQPCRRTEDLLRDYGVRYGCIALSDACPHPRTAIPFSQLSIAFSTRRIDLVLVTPASKSGSRRLPPVRTTILKCARARDEKLEVVARKLAIALRSWIHDREQSGWACKNT